LEKTIVTPEREDAKKNSGYVGRGIGKKELSDVNCVILIWLVSDGSELVRLEGQLRSSLHLG